jgi:hypothetical protein
MSLETCFKCPRIWLIMVRAKGSPLVRPRTLVQIGLVERDLLKVRFSPDSDHLADIPRGPVCACQERTFFGWLGREPINLD